MVLASKLKIKIPFKLDQTDKISLHIIDTSNM